MEKTPLDVAREVFPWQVPGIQRGKLYDVLQDHSEYMATGGRQMPEWRLTRLRSFYDKLASEDLVIEHHPDIPPNEDAENGGFAFRQRQESDGTLIVRENDVTNLTKEGRRIWRIPPRLL